MVKKEDGKEIQDTRKTTEFCIVYRSNTPLLFNLSALAFISLWLLLPCLPKCLPSWYSTICLRQNSVGLQHSPCHHSRLSVICSLPSSVSLSWPIDAHPLSSSVNFNVPCENTIYKKHSCGTQMCAREKDRERDK